MSNEALPRPGSIGLREQDPNTFPSEVFEWFPDTVPPTGATPFLRLRTPWLFYIGTKKLGSLSNYAVSSADYTVLDNDSYDVLRVTTGAATRTITLPTAADNVGRILYVLKVDSAEYFVIIDGEGSETINGVASFTLYGQYSALVIQSNGTSWDVLGYNPSACVLTASTTFSALTGDVKVVSNGSSLAHSIASGGTFVGDTFSIVNKASTAVTLTVTTGANTVTLNQNDWLSLVWDGTAWEWAGGSYMEWFYVGSGTSAVSGNFIAPFGGKFFASVIGGGGGSGGARMSTSGAGYAGAGGGGGYAERAYNLIAGATYAYIAGGGGANGVGATPTAGGAGDTSSFAGPGATITGAGGGGGAQAWGSSSTVYGAGGSGGSGSNGTRNHNGERGCDGGLPSYGGAGGVNFSSLPLRSYECPQLFNVPAVSSGWAGVAGLIYGGGAQGASRSGTAGNYDGADGAIGYCLIQIGGSR